MKIAFASDHIGFALKLYLLKELEGQEHECVDFGTYSQTERTDYPIWGKKAAEVVANGEYDRGILICGTGLGISLAANKIHGIRAVLCSDCYTAELSRLHNDSNMLAMGAKVVGEGLALQIAQKWLRTAFEAGRHQKRIEMLARIEQGLEIEKDG